MLGSNWNKRASSFKRHVASALTRVVGRFERSTKVETAFAIPERTSSRTELPIPDEQVDQGLPSARPYSTESTHWNGDHAPEPDLELEPPPVKLVSDCAPSFDDVSKPPIDEPPSAADESADESVVSAPSQSASYPKRKDDEAPNEVPVLDRLVPECSVENNGTWLMHGSQQAPDAPIFWTSGRSGQESLPALEASASRRLLAFADSENAFTPVTDTLRYAGVLKKSGELKRKVVRGLEIVHTGDMILKHRPNPAVVKYWVELGERIKLLGGELVLLAGNHELEIWDCLQRGQRLGMKRRQSEQVGAFIRNCRLFYVSDSVMFLHGYPTLNLLRRLKQFQERTGLNINHFDEQCFQPAFDDPRELAHYRYFRGKGTQKLLLHDLENPATYYRTHGRDIAALLRNFGIEQVVHGHRPERSGIQADYEFRRWLPGIRMIGNDTQLRQRGLGAVIMRAESEEEAKVLFVNTRTSGVDQRKSVRRLLRQKSPNQPYLIELEARRIAAAMASRQVPYNRANIPVSQPSVGIWKDPPRLG